MSAPDVILVGASVRSLAESAIRGGLCPLCLDQFADADLQLLLADHFGRDAPLLRKIGHFRDVRALLQPYGSGVPVVVAGGMENHLELTKQLRKDHHLVGADPQTVGGLRDPDVLFPTLQTQGVPVPSWQLKARSMIPGSVRWLRKNFHSSGGQQVTMLDSEVRMEAKSSAIRGSDYLQEFVDGISISATFLAESPPAVHAGLQDQRSASREMSVVRLLGVALQLSGTKALNATGFQFCGNAGPVLPNQRLREEIRRIGQVITSQWPVCGVFGVDMIVRNNRPFVLEVNPRITASHELHEWANPHRPGHVALQLGHRGDRNLCGIPAAGTARCWARMVVYADVDLAVTSRRQRDLMRLIRPPGQAPGSSPVWLADIPFPGAVVRKGMPVCSVYMELIDGFADTRDLQAICDVLPLQRPLQPAGLVANIQGQIALLEVDPEFRKS